jgi:hypothetical protein
MTLGEKQRLFTRLVGILIEYAYQQGYELTFGEAERKPAQASANESAGKGISNSLHIVRLAIDLNLFKDGQWLTLSEYHNPLGVFWKNLHPLCRWGGDFKDSLGRPKPDGNHYSLEHNGVK